jgi:gliding motility-associated protein GldM
MINLMYLVFIGMLALNVSTEVLDGFELVEESLLRSVKSSSSRNELVFQDLETYHSSNPEKTKNSYEQAEKVKAKSDSLFNYIQDLKVRIVKKADGKEGNPEQLKHPDDLNASFEVMFEHGKNDGRKLKESIDNYRDYVTSLVYDTVKLQIIQSNLSTEPSQKASANKQSWEESMFDKMPVAAAVTLLTKMQNDIRYAEGEVLSDLLRNIDVKDFRVNNIEAKVIPQSQVVMRGGNYTADIVLSAQDTTQRPTIFVNGKFLPEELNGKYVVGAGSTGTFPVNGYIEINSGTGFVLRKEFSTNYFVIEQSATVAPTMMNVLYAGFKNPIEIAVPGVASQNVSATMSNGSLTSSGGGWIAVPSKVGTDAVVTVTAKMGDGRTISINKSFRVVQLPDPTPYIQYADANGNPIRFKKSGRLAKATLLNTNELKAAIDDGLLNIEFSVLKFETITFDQFGNTMRDASDGPRFSQKQKDRIRDLARNKIFLIRGVVARGPDGIEREIGVLEVTVN